MLLAVVRAKLDLDKTDALFIYFKGNKLYTNGKQISVNKNKLERLIL